MKAGKDIAILCDGDFPNNKETLSRLDSCNVIICCDGAVTALEKSGRKCDYIAGDMDTLSLSQQLSHRHIIISDPDQQTNDQTKSFKLALSLSPSAIHIFGATGKREDHTIGNISLLAEYASIIRKEGIKCSIDMISDYGIFVPYYGSFEMTNCRPGEQISLFAFDNSLKVHSEGLKYPVDGITFDLWWKATLNEATGTLVKIVCNHPADMLVFRNFNL
ncbi:MAG: thiamine diphosphokinase [Bacteroidales bacterium]|jgi:thiamine pyrophosphokinase|nr:thiamine diphosphokinase [Bacteroidales bacterium]